jgi:hypothetical protein
VNFHCVFEGCNFKADNIEESEFQKHLDDKHPDELLDISNKENIPLETVSMITVSNSKVFINS